MSFFKFNYDKPGKGIEKDAPEKNIFLTYLGLYKRNFVTLTKLNILYVLASIPAILILGFLFTLFVYPHLITVINELASSVVKVDANQVQATYLGIFLGIFVTEMLLILGSGPASAAFSHITRTITREEHVWLWSDFIAKFKENFKQSMIVWFINVFVAFMIFNAGIFYLSIYHNTQNMLYLILFGFIALLLFVFISINGYIYQMMVTFDNKLTALYRNSLLLSLAKFPQNLLLTILPIVVTLLLFSKITPVSSAILLILFWISFMRFPMEFYASRTLLKLIEDERKKEVQKGSEE